MRHYDRAIELDPQNKEAMCNKAAALLKLKQWPEAAAVAEQVRWIVPMLGCGSGDSLREAAAGLICFTQQPGVPAALCAPTAGAAGGPAVSQGAVAQGACACRHGRVEHGAAQHAGESPAVLRWALLSCGGCGLHGTQRLCTRPVAPGLLLQAASAPGPRPSWL